MVGVVTACSSSSKDAGNAAASPATSGSGGSSSSAVADAQRIVDAAQKALVYAPVDTGSTAGQIVPQTTWQGPKTGPKPLPKQKVEVVFCAAGTACETVAKGAQAAGQLLGWDVELIAGSGTAQSYATAMDTALSRKPNAIIGVAIPGASVADRLATAKQRGIVTVSAPDSPTNGTNPWQAYVSIRQPLTYQIMAYQVIADSNGAGDAIVVRQADQPDLIKGVTEYQRVMQSCQKCKTKVVDLTIPDQTNPAVAGQKLAAAISSEPGVQYLVLPDDNGFGNMIAAVQSSGKKIKIIAKDATNLELQAINTGDVYAAPGASLDWMGYAAINQVNLGLNKQPYLNAYDQGLGIHIYTKADAPADGTADFTKYVDWVSGYKTLWGVQ
jgi:ABC-type sugar transport system substrate-binding protein